MSRDSDQQAQTEDRPASGIITPVARERSSPGEFLREVRAELKKVAWPTREEVINYAIVVLVVSLVLTLFVAGMDWLFQQAAVNFFG